jgi:hypothetical protein
VPARLRIGDGASGADLAALCARAAALCVDHGTEPLECDVGGVTAPDLGTVNALARVELTVRRRGGSVRLIGASVELLDLLAFCGLPFRLALEADRLAEEREEARRVEEERDPRDPVA